MTELHEELETLRELNNFRIRARELREQGLRPLKKIKNIKKNEKGKNAVTEIIIEGEGIDFDGWFASGNHVETSLLVKVQNHRDLSENEKDNEGANAGEELKKGLTPKIKSFFQPIIEGKINEAEAQPTVPVLMAARIMQSLLTRSETVFSETTMVCYYRIVRELYIAGNPDWTFGAARAGKDCGTSAFVTGECIRAIFALDNAVKSTIEFAENTLRLYERYNWLKEAKSSLGAAGKNRNHPLGKWADRAIERMWLDCYLSTNPRGRQIAFYCGAGGGTPNQLLLSYDVAEINMAEVEKYFLKLKENLLAAAKTNEEKISLAETAIKQRREETEKPNELTDEKFQKLNKRQKNERKEQQKAFERTASAHSAAFGVIEDAVKEAGLTIKEIESGENLKIILRQLIKRGEAMSRHIRKLLDPIKQYIKTVIRRELAASPSMFDAGELVFAATAFGAMNDWTPNELISRSCEKLVEALPESGRLLTKRPLHSTQRGYRLLPIGCEMTRALAQLFQKTNYEVTPKLVGRMLNIFEEKIIPLDESEKKNEMIAWNYDGSPNPKKPCVWVTAVAVLALDRVVRMLNTRINNSVLKHFEVIKPDKPHRDMTLNDLIYSDYGLSEYYFGKHEETYGKQLSTPIRLEQMRAHTTRATLPKRYDEHIFSTIFYGPPGTGKTTLAEAMALSSQVPVLSLSPSDLMVQGQALIEGRARDVFEALSMLTQAVIIFDEFEPVLKSRAEDDEDNEEKAPEKDGETDSSPPVADEPQLKLWKEAVGELKAIGRKDDATFKFLLAGMLPKLLKLHDTAERQSLVYCLATNYLKEIDEAAKRRGRFDSKMPVYNPCPLSRAGTFLFRLSQIEKTDGQKLDLTKSKQLKNFIDVILATANEPASELSGNYFKIKPDGDKFKAVSDYFDYILSGKEVSLNLDKIEEMKKLLKEKKVEKFEVAEREWLIKFEEKFRDKGDLAKRLSNPN